MKPPADNIVASGACNCGAVSFEINCGISQVYVCHCSICRRLTGAGGIAVVVVPNDAFRWTGNLDSIHVWKKPGHDWAAYFCSICGSTLPGPNDDARMFVPAGLILEGAQDLKVAHHIFVGSKAAWDEIGDSGLRHVGALGTDPQ